MSQHNNIYNILDKLHKLDPTVKTPVETNTKPIYESVEANGSIFSGIKKVEQKLSEDFNSFKEQDMTEGEGNVAIGQQMANDGITYSPEKENELIDLIAQYMKKSGMSSKSIRYYLSYDEDYISDQLSYLPRKDQQGMAEGDEAQPAVKVVDEYNEVVAAFDDMPKSWRYKNDYEVASNVAKIASEDPEMDPTTIVKIIFNNGRTINFEELIPHLIKDGWMAPMRGQGIAEGDVMRHTGDKTVKVLKKAGKPIGEIGIDGDASPGGGQYYVKLYDGSLDESGFDTAKEAWEELTYAVKQSVAEAINETEYPGQLDTSKLILKSIRHTGGGSHPGSPGYFDGPVYDNSGQYIGDLGFFPGGKLSSGNHSWPSKAVLSVKNPRDPHLQDYWEKMGKNKIGYGNFPLDYKITDLNDPLMKQAISQVEKLKQGVAEDTNPRKAGYGTYGTEYQGDNDDEEENQRQADAGKRGRGRPRTRPIKVSKGTGKRGRPVGTGKNQQTTGKKYEPAALHTALGGGTAPKKHANSRTVKPLGKNEGFERLFQKKLNESCLMDDSGNTFNHILNTYKRDVSDFKKTCNVQDLSDHLYNALYDYYEDDMPYAVKSASSRRDAPDPYEWITERFCQDLGLDKTATTEEGIAVAGPMPLADADNELNELAKLAGLKVADEGNAFTGKLAKTRNGDMFDLDGIKYTDTSTLDEGHCDSCNCNPCECSNDMYPTLEAKGDYGDTTINEVPDYINAPDEEVMSTDAIVHQGNDLNREKKQFASKPKLGDNPMAETTEIDPIATLGRALMQEYETLKLSK